MLEHHEMMRTIGINLGKLEPRMVKVGPDLPAALQKEELVEFLSEFKDAFA